MKNKIALFIILIVTNISVLEAADDGCALSLDMWIVGETCVISGIKLQYGEIDVLGRFNPSDGSHGGLDINPNYPLFPVGLASEQKDIGWFYLNSFVEFNLMETYRTGELILTENNELLHQEHDQEGSGHRDGVMINDILTEEQLTAFNEMVGSDYESWGGTIASTYQYVGFGYNLATKNRFLQPALGLGLIYNQYTVQVYVHERNKYQINAIKIFDLEYTAISLLANVSITLWKGENLTVGRVGITGYLSKPFYVVHSKYSNNKAEYDLTGGLVYAEWISWSFLF